MENNIHYSFFVKRTAEGGGCERSFFWNGARWLSEKLGKFTTYHGDGKITERFSVRTRRIPDRRKTPVWLRKLYKNGEGKKNENL